MRREIDINIKLLIFKIEHVRRFISLGVKIE